MSRLHLTIWICCVFGVTAANHGSPSPITGQDFRGQNSQPVFISCPTDGSDEADIYWIKPDGQRVTQNIESNVYSFYKEEQLILVIAETNEADEGEYKCLEENILGEMTERERFMHHALAEKSPPKFDEPYVIVEAYEETNVSLWCEASGDLPMDFFWLDANNTVLISSRPDLWIYKRSNYSELCLAWVSNVRNNSLFICAANNSLGTSSKIFKLVLKERSGVYPPLFNSSVQYAYGVEYGSLAVKCEADGMPRPSYTWFDIYGRELNENHSRVIELDQEEYNSSHISEVLILVSKNDGFLIFSNLTRSDAGSYRCEAENELGSASTIYKIYVRSSGDQFPPNFEESNAQVPGKINHTLTLYCHAEGYPPPTYSWYNRSGVLLDRFHPRVIDLDRLNDTSIPNVKPSSILISNVNGTLTFVALSEKDIGRYTCFASNRYGHSGKLFWIYLNETGDPDNYDVVVSVRNVTESSVTFDLYTSSSARVIEVRYNLDGKRDLNRTEWRIGEDYTVSDLLPGARYQFQFRALAVGNSTWSQPPTIVALLPRAPEIIVRQVEPQKVKLEFFRPIYLFDYKTIDRYIIKYRTVQVGLGGNTWDYGTCEVTIILPSCSGNSYEISNLQQRVYYSITVQAAGPSGYSKSSEMKIYLS